MRLFHHVRGMTINKMIYRYSLRAEDLLIDHEEVFRYLGYKKNTASEEEHAMLEENISEARQVIFPKACYGRFEIKHLGDDYIEFPYGVIRSKNLSFNLGGCNEIYMFAATIGARFDAAKLRVSAASITKAALYQAIGATAIEDVCNKLNKMLKDESEAAGEKVRPRYSPGFGDYVLENQKGVFKILCPEKNAGITLGDNLIMAPEKSVTAIIGIEK